MDLFQSFSTYTAPPSSSDLNQRPDKTFVVKSQVEFLALAAHLQVPVISAQNNVFTGINKVHVGEGASFTALSSTEALSFSKDGDILNPSLGAKRWFDENKAKKKFHHYVTKKIKPSQQLGYTDDSQQLSAAINELRVLSKKIIRECDSIVSLLAISWSEDHSLGRVWPQVLLEAADQGNLEQYLSSTEINFQSKMEIAVQIANGLEFLYAEQIVHADIKPANILIFSRKGNDFPSDDLAVDSMRLLPVTAKICDFGYAIILKDYGSQEQFQGRIGSNPWMSPELDGGEPIELCYLHKSDVYSFGLLIASIVMDCHVPFAGTAPERILESKTRRSEDPDSAVNILMGNLKGKVILSEYEEEFVRALLTGTCDPLPENRTSFAAIRKYVFLGSRHGLDPGGPVTPLSFLRPQSFDPVRGYLGILAKLDRAHRSPLSKQETRLTVEALLRFTDTNDQPLKDGLTYIYEDNRPKPAALGSLDLTWKPDALRRVPDFAFENGLKPSLLPRAARKEVFNDLKSACNLEFDGDPDSIYEIAGAYLNGQVVDLTTDPPSSTSVQSWIDIGLKHLAAAAMRRSPEAVAILLNVFEACDTVLPGDVRNELLAMVKDHVSEVIWESQASLFDDTPAHLLASDKTTSKTWASGLSQWYYEFLSARQRAYDTAPSSHKDVFTLYPNGHSVFGFQLLTSYETRTSQRLSQRNKQAFKREVIRLRCAHACDDLSSFTLLQIAAVKDDLELAKVLVTELGVSVDSYGNTPAWTPLLLSCHLGHFAMAKWLIDNGASPRIKGFYDGATILHFIHRFTERYQCESILDAALSADVDINSPLENGQTPLFTSLSGRDYSGGLAAQLLLKFGADPTRKVFNERAAGALGFATPMGLAARGLKVDLLRKMLAAAESLVLYSVGPYAQRQLVDAKAQAFEALMIHTPLHYMCVGGKGYRESIENIIFLLADEQVASKWATFLSTRSQLPMSLYPVDPFLCLSTTCVGSGLFTKPILKARPQAIVEDPSLTLPWNFLHLAIERRSRESISALLEYGASVLTKGQYGRHALHVAAQYFPEILPEFIAILESLAPEKRQGKSITEILEEKDERGVTTFDILLIMGYDAERQLAEFIREKFSLKHDHKIHDATIHETGEWVTFGSYMVEQAARSGRIMIEHIEYLFSLNPLPDFIADDSGNNLFICAIAQFAGFPDSYHLPCHQIAKLLFTKYPAYNNFVSVTGNPSRSTMHIAAMRGNTTALKMIKDHMKHHFPDKPFPWNLVAEGRTLLDHATYGLKERKIFSNLSESSNKASLSEAASACYKFLRENAALHNWELDGLFFGGGVPLPEQDHPAILEFIHDATLVLGLGTPDIDIEDSVDLGDVTIHGGRGFRQPVVELIWRYDRFLIRHYYLKLHCHCREINQEVEKWMHKRQTDDRTKILDGLQLDPGVEPPMVQKYKHHTPLTTEELEWSRPGRLWTWDEISHLGNDFSKIWGTAFDKLLEGYPRPSHCHCCDEEGRETLQG